MILLLGSTAWPDLCASRSEVPECCRGKACPMRMHNAEATCAIGGCDDREPATIDAAHVERAIAIALPTLTLPGSAAVRFAMLDTRPLAGIGRTPDRPPRLVSPSR